MSDALTRWEMLRREVNGLPPLVGTPGVRDPEYQCAAFDARGYDGRGDCPSDGHYMCAECSGLSPEAPRFEGRDGRRDRLRLFWKRRQNARSDGSG